MYIVERREGNRQTGEEKKRSKQKGLSFRVGRKDIECWRFELYRFFRIVVFLL